MPDQIMVLIFMNYVDCKQLISQRSLAGLGETFDHIMVWPNLDQTMAIFFVLTKVPRNTQNKVGRVHVHKPMNSLIKELEMLCSDLQLLIT
jgi:hypothetical protein